jgi:hypothetical protein
MAIHAEWLQRVLPAVTLLEAGAFVVAPISVILDTAFVVPLGFEAGEQTQGDGQADGQGDGQGDEMPHALWLDKAGYFPDPFDNDLMPSCLNAAD